MNTKPASSADSEAPAAPSCRLPGGSLAPGSLLAGPEPAVAGPGAAMAAEAGRGDGGGASDPNRGSAGGAGPAGRDLDRAVLARRADEALYEMATDSLPAAPQDPVLAALREGRLQEWIATHRAHIWIVGIGAMTIGSILCMMIFTLVLIITR